MKKIVCILIFFSGACKQAYDPPVHSTNNSYLVVEGFINNGQDTTFISLSHTFKLDDSSLVTPELHAKLTVEGKDNSSVPLVEWGGGRYGAASLVLNNALQYRLHIRTVAGNEYVSDYLDLKTSPPIDSISWQKTAGGVQIYANSHDPQNASHYYRWEYQDTWEFNSTYFATIQYVNHKVTPLNIDSFYTCWKYNSSTSILLGSTTKLAADEVSLAPLVLIPNGSWELSKRYSILVRQYVLTIDAFNFWQQMQKNTEQIGSIFSPQPTEAKGNLHAVKDTSELVIGFISAGTLRQQRIFITPDQVPNWISQSHFDCSEMNIPEDSLEFYLVRLYGNLPIGPAPTTTPENRYFIAASPCVDCRLTGTNVKPPFWP